MNGQNLAGSASPVAALVLAWAIPGAGDVYAGRWGKGLLFFGCIVGLLVAGMLIGGGTVIIHRDTQGHIELWWMAQMGAGGPTVALTPISEYLAARAGSDIYANRYREVGTLYAAVAGFLNVLVMMDAYVKLAYPHRRREEDKEDS
jgi:TM2 domain-containing membrane protein YozV